MSSRSIASGLCWFGATCLALGVFGLAIAAIEVHAGGVRMKDALGLLVLSVVAFGAMIALMVLGLRIDRRSGRTRPMPGRK